MTNEQNAVAVFDPVAAGRALRRQVEDRRPQLAALLGVNPETERGAAMLDRFVTVALHAATSNNDLLECTPESLVESIRQSAILGLEPTGALGEGAIVRYNVSREEERETGTGKNRRTIKVRVPVPTAQFQPMYRGLMKLARRSNEIRVIDAAVVYAGDLFEIELGTSPSIRHVPWPQSGAKDRGEPVSVYAFAKLTSGETLIEPLTVADIEAVRRSSRAKDVGPWVSFWSEMARKTALRRLMKRLPLESLADQALRLEAQSEAVAVPEIPATTGFGNAPLDRLRGRLGLSAGDQPEDAPVDQPGEPPADDAPPAEEPAEEASFREETPETASRPRCGAPGMAEGVSCVLDPGHGGQHAGDGGETWL